MGRIQLLDKVVAELIAAGEVVERPSSVVKELIENSIDAGASKITVEVKGGGIGYIRITDNGSGIHHEDIPYAFLRHATSKVAKEEDLYAISTLGFRGEALASISAVAKVAITTKTADSLDGWFYEVQGGTALEIPSIIGAPHGTTLVIRDVFYNTPARMKFLRSDIAEGNAVAQVVDKCALSHPEISFTFIRDTKTRLKTSGNGDLLAVISGIYGRELAGDMLKVDYRYDDKIRVHGYVGAPGNTRPSRAYQTFFVNDRYVVSRTCSAAMQEGFKGKLMTGKFPVGVLFVTLPPSEVDANVHPAKIEVRFTQERSIFSAVYYAVKNTLAQQKRVIDPPDIKPSVSKNPDNQSEEEPDTFTAPPKSTVNIDIAVEPFIQQKLRPDGSVASESPYSPMDSLSLGSMARSVPRDISGTTTIRAGAELPQGLSVAVQALDATKAEQSDFPDNYQELKFVGELFGTYILLENSRQEMVVVDKHAAHERILYEEILENAESGNRQILLSAVPVSLQRDEYAVLLENLDVLESLGFLAEDFGTGTLLVRETALPLEGEDITFLLSEIATSLLAHKTDLTPTILSQLYYSIACKSAIRGGDISQKAELMEIIKRLEHNPEITHCPHGRPVAISLSRKEIEKLFGRLG